MYSNLWPELKKRHKEELLEISKSFQDATASYFYPIHEHQCYRCVNEVFENLTFHWSTIPYVLQRVVISCSNF